MTIDLALALTEAIILDKTRDIGKAACCHIERKIPDEEMDTYALVAYTLLLTDLEKREIVDTVLGKIRKEACVR